MRLNRTTIGSIAAVAALTIATIAAPAGAQSGSSGIHVSNGKIYEADGSQLILRGINHAHAWYPSQTQSFADIGATGANSVRTVLSSGYTWTKNSASDVNNVINLAKNADLISILEVHDTTGYGDAGATPARSTLDAAANYWIEMKGALIGQEDYVLVNLGNEPFGNDSAANANYVSHTKAAIKKLRDAGIKNAIVVDAPNWGQDWQNLMRDNAQEIFSSDPEKNVIFDIHMYQVFGTASSVTSYMDAFASKSLPLIVGEFGDYHDGTVAWETILSESKARGLGYLGWSWSGNGDGVEYLDVANGFIPSSLSQWGQRLINGTNGIKATSVKASIFGGDGGTGGSGSTDGYPTCASSASDPDGDGWGWENNQSCKVAASGGTGGSGSTDGYPTCASSASDPDGDGWGWENSQSCKVAASGGTGGSGSTDGYPTCASSASDPDGDGWGWENNQSCKVK